MSWSFSTDDSKKAKENIKKFKIVAIGNCNVGKTCLLRRLCGEGFSICSQTTIGFQVIIRKVIIENEAVELHFWDTSGQERYRKEGLMQEMIFRGMDGALLVYNITDASSFYGAHKWLEVLDKYTEKLDIPIVLIGNKADRESERDITSKMGKEIARDMELGHSNIRFFETSAAGDEYLRSREAIVNHLAVEAKLYNEKYSTGTDSIKLGSRK